MTTLSPIDDRPPFDPWAVRSDTAEPSGPVRAALGSASAVFGALAGGGLGLAVLAVTGSYSDALFATPLVGIGAGLAGRRFDAGSALAVSLIALAGALGYVAVLEALGANVLAATPFLGGRTLTALVCLAACAPLALVPVWMGLGR